MINLLKSFLYGVGILVILAAPIGYVRTHPFYIYCPVQTIIRTPGICLPLPSTATKPYYEDTPAQPDIDRETGRGSLEGGGAEDDSQGLQPEQPRAKP